MKVDPAQVEEVARELYVRALKILPPDVKEGFARLASRETDATARQVLGTMIANIRVAEETRNLLCQDTGIPMYKVTIGRGVEFVGTELEPDHTVSLLASCGHDDDGHRGTGTESTADVEPVAVGQVQVEQDECRIDTAGGLERLGGGARHHGLEAVSPESSGKGLEDRRLVFDEQDSPRSV